jgi:hypothetical protein
MELFARMMPSPWSLRSREDSGDESSDRKTARERGGGD